MHGRGNGAEALLRLLGRGGSLQHVQQTEQVKPRHGTKSGKSTQPNTSQCGRGGRGPGLGALPRPNQEGPGRAFSTPFHSPIQAAPTAVPPPPAAQLVLQCASLTTKNAFFSPKLQVL